MMDNFVRLGTTPGGCNWVLLSISSEGQVGDRVLWAARGSEQDRLRAWLLALKLSRPRSRLPALDKGGIMARNLIHMVVIKKR